MKPNLKSHIAVLTLIGMIIGLLFARAVASVSMILFGLNAIWDVHPKRWLKSKWWLLGLAWIAMYALSFFWTENIGEWNAHLQVKLPFLLLPLAFGLLPPFKEIHLRLFTWSLVIMMCIGALYSMAPLWQTSEAWIDRYKYAHVLPTLMRNDHISFSATVALTVAWVIYYFPKIESTWQRWLLGILVLFLAIYLHVLAAKTGLIALYILFAGIIVIQLRKQPKKGVLILSLAVLFVTTAYVLIPTFRERIGYSVFTWKNLKNGEREGNYSDEGRLISYDLACRFISKHPLLGVGAGDVFDEMKTGYQQFYPKVLEAQMLWPHNQFLTIAMAAGIPAMLFFLIWILWPFRLVRRNREGQFFTIVWLMLLVLLMVDPILEVQAGVGVYLIFLLWQRYFLLNPLLKTQSTQ